MTIRLGDSFPQLGDAIVESAGTVFLQRFDVDCAALTADLVFGVPDHLAPEDMAALLSGFRNKRTCASATTRKTGKPTDGGADVELGGIPPLSSTEFAPGQKSKTIFGSTAANSPSMKFDATGSGGNVEVKSSDIPSGKTIAVKTLTVKGAGANGADKTFKVLADDDVTIPKGGASLDKEFQLAGVKVADIAASANINVTQKTIVGDTASGIDVTESNGVITIRFTGGASGTSGFTGTRYTLKETKYDNSSNKLMMKRYTETWADGVMTDSVEGSWEDFSAGAQAVQETV